MSELRGVLEHPEQPSLDTPLRTCNLTLLVNNVKVANNGNTTKVYGLVEFELHWNP